MYFTIFICKSLFNGHSIGSGLTKFGSENDAEKLGVVKTTYRLSAHFGVEIFPQI
jgi:hypothetical protein